VLANFKIGVLFYNVIEMLGCHVTLKAVPVPSSLNDASKGFHGPPPIHTFKRHIHVKDNCEIWH
jgi:hypothetical protein